jgi:hypothetical protein
MAKTFQWENDIEIPITMPINTFKYFQMHWNTLECIQTYYKYIQIYYEYIQIYYEYIQIYSNRLYIHLNTFK